MKRIVMVVALLALATAACARDTAEEAPAPSGAGDMAVEDTDVARGEEEAPSDEGPADLVTPDRKVIRTGHIEVEVEDTRAAMEAIEAMVRAGGGFVASSEVRPVEEELGQPTISLTVRVPAEDLDSTMASIRELATEVISETVTATDVTEEYVDLEARIANLEVLEQELRALLAEVRQRESASPEELLEVFRELSNVRGQIEQLEGRRELIASRVALSTLTIQLVPVPAEIEIVEDEWEPGERARGALRSLVDALQWLGDAVITVVLFLLPILLVSVVPVLAIAWVVWRAVRRRREREAGSATEPERE